MGADKRVPSPVVPRSRSGEYHSSSTESDSVMNDVQHVTDPRWRDQALHHVNSTTVPCVRQLSNSSSDSIGGIVCGMECTGTTASLQGPRTLQVSQVIPADPRAEGARPSAQEGRGNRYPLSCTHRAHDSQRLPKEHAAALRTCTQVMRVRPRRRRACKDQLHHYRKSGLKDASDNCRSTSTGI